MMNPKKRRNKKERFLNRTFVFLVEGKTEEIYLNYLKDLINEELKNRERKQISFQITVTKDLKSFFKDVQLNSEIYIVSDIESHTVENETKIKNFIEQFKLFKENKVSWIWMYSNLSFEAWLLQHTEIPFRKSLSKPEQYLDEINKTFNTNYQTMRDFKNQKNFNKFLHDNITLDNVLIAVENCKRLNENHSEVYNQSEYNKNNPSTTFNIGVENILRKVKLLDLLDK